MSKFSRVSFHIMVAWNIHTVVFFYFFSFLFSDDILLMLVEFVYLVSALIRLHPSLCSLRCRFIDASTLSWGLGSPVSPSFPDTCSPSTPYLECKNLCIITSFLILWIICWSSTLVHFNKCSWVYQKWDSLSVYPFIEISAMEFGFEYFPASPEIRFFFIYFYNLLMFSTSNMTEGIKQPKQEKIRMFRKKETNKYLWKCKIFSAADVSR